MSENIRWNLVTHDGQHHADDVMACWFWTVLLGDEVRIIRSVDPEVIKNADIRVDCGKSFDPGKGDWDHHWCEVPSAPPHRPAGYSSVGLMWLVMGRRIVHEALMQLDDSDFRRFYMKLPRAEALAIRKELAARMEHDVIVPIDFWDLGGRPKTEDPFLPMQWILKVLSFEEAMAACGKAFMRRLHHLARVYHKAAEIREALRINERYEFFCFGRGLVVRAGCRVDEEAARRVARSELHMPLHAVVSKTQRGDGAYCLILSYPAHRRFEVSENVEMLGDRRIAFSKDPDLLLELTKSLAVFEIEVLGRRDYNDAHAESN